MAININGLTKHYGNTIALENVSLTFEENKIYGLLGRNGAGKTTLLNILTGRQQATGGSATLDGQEIWENDNALGQMYMLSEQTLYPSSMKVQDAFKWSATFYEKFDTAFANNLAGQFGIPLGKKISSLSTGYGTIFKLVIALSSGAPYLLLDEPVLGLDANHRDLFYKTLIARYAENPFCAVLSTHLVEEVSSIVEDVVIIHKGQILKNEPRDTLLAQGYTVSGSAALVDEFIKGKQVLACDTLGGLKTAHILGQRAEVTPGLEVSSLDLQKLFVQLTNI